MAEPTAAQETAWREASTKGHPLYDQKKRDIKQLVDKMKAGQDKIRTAHEEGLGDDLIELAGPVVHAGLEKSGSVSRFSRAYLRNYDKVFGES